MFAFVNSAMKVSPGEISAVGVGVHRKPGWAHVTAPWEQGGVCLGNSGLAVERGGMRSRRLAAGRVPEPGDLGVYHGGNPRGDLGVKQTWVETLGLGKERCYCLPGVEGARQERGLGGCRSPSCLSVALPALPQAAILQQTAEYIFSLEQEKTRLLQQNTQLKRFIQVVPGWEGVGQSWLAGEGTLLLFLGIRRRPSAPISWGTGMSRTLLAGQGSPVQSSVP